LQPPIRSEPNAGRLQAAPTHDFVWQALDTYFFESALSQDAHYCRSRLQRDNPPKATTPPEPSLGDDTCSLKNRIVCIERACHVTNVTYNYGKSCIISLTVYSVRPVIIYHFAHCAVEHSLPVIPNPARATPSAYTMRIDSKMSRQKKRYAWQHHYKRFFNEASTAAGYNGKRAANSRQTKING